MFEDIEQALRTRGLDQDVRRAIKNSKICIIDDQIEDLKSFTDGLEAEGFTNLVKLESVDSVNGLLEQSFDLIILDLMNVASDICDQDGIGVLASLKDKDPLLPILVVSGSTTSPDKSTVLARADLIRTKPVLPADLASDVDELVKRRKDKLWASLAVLQGLARIEPEIAAELGLLARAKLWYHKKRVISKVTNFDIHLDSDLIAIASVLTNLGSIASGLIGIVRGITG